MAISCFSTQDVDVSVTAVVYTAALQLLIQR